MGFELSNAAQRALVRGAMRVPPHLAGPRMSLFGDSLTDMNSRNIQPPSSSPSRGWMADGPMTWARIRSNQRFHIDPDGDFGVSGDTLQMMLARIDDVIDYRPTHCVVMGGSNNFTVDNFTTIRDTWLEIVETLMDNDITPIIMPCPPRAGSVLTVAQVHLQHRYTQFQREWCRANPGTHFVDYLPFITDQTSAVSAPLAGMIKADNLHFSTAGAFWAGAALADLFNKIFPETGAGFLSAADYFSADNPTGNLLYTGTTNKGLLANTGGTATASTNLTYVNNGLAANAQFIRASASATATVTLEKQNPRTDRKSGERQIIEIAANSGATADEVYNLRISPALADIAVGDWYYAECTIEILTAPVNLWALELYLLETRPGANQSQTAIEMAHNSSLAGVMPSELFKGVWRTPAIQRQSDATAIQLNNRPRFKTDAGAASVRYAIGDMAVRKLIL